MKHYKTGAYADKTNTCITHVPDFKNRIQLNCAQCVHKLQQYMSKHASACDLL